MQLCAHLMTRQPVCVAQDEFCEIVNANPGATPSMLFDYTKPRRSTKRRASSLTLSEEQENALYALVGCQVCAHAGKNGAVSKHAPLLVGRGASGWLGAGTW